MQNSRSNGIYFSKESVQFFGYCMLMLLCSFFAETQGQIALSVVFDFATLILIFRKSSESNLFHLMWNISLVLFGFLPPLMLLAAGVQLELWILRLLLLVSVIVILVTDSDDYKGSSVSDWHVEVRTVVFFVAVALGGMVLTDGGSFLYLTPAVVMLAALAANRASRSGFLLLVAAYAIYLATYIFIFWDGFGRLILAATLIPLYFVIARERGWYFNKYVLTFSALIGGMLASLSRIKDTSLTEAILSDSTTSPYILAAHISSQLKDKSIDLNGWMDQFFSFLYILIPREVWSNKPLGFGRDYVVKEYDASYLDSVHSIAALFMGEHMYYLTNYWMIGVVVSLVLLIAIFKLFSRFDNGSGIWGVLVCLWVPTYFWNGIASFSARFQISLMAIVCIFIARQLWLKMSRRAFA